MSKPEESKKRQRRKCSKWLKSITAMIMRRAILHYTEVYLEPLESVVWIAKLLDKISQMFS